MDKKEKAAMIYVHGGGGFKGVGITTVDLFENVANGTNIVIFAMNYRMAPKYKMSQTK